MTRQGNYAKICTHVRDTVDAAGAVVLVIEGNRGTGFSAQASPELLALLPDYLRNIANRLEVDATILAARISSKTADRAGGGASHPERPS